MARVGRYELLGRLATGGMAELFLARAEGIEGFEKILVLKRILPGRAADDDFVAMFLQEARLAATLHHSNIVQVYDIGVEDGSYYFTMEFLRGKDLRDLARATFKNKERIPLTIVVQIIAGIAAGLHYAHEKCDSDGNPLQLVHRDVSPANVFVTWDGGVKLVDFGIAKAASAESTTQAGVLKGKVPYMSPEQCQGKSLDRRSDIFALGTLLWEYSVGRRLWKGEHELMTIKKIANDAPPKPSTFYPEYPSDLERIVLKALANDPEQRYQTAQEFQLDLEMFARDQGWVLSSARLSQYLLETFPDQTTMDTVLADLDPVVVDKETRADIGSVESDVAAGPRAPWTWLVAGSLAAVGLVTVAAMAGGERVDRALLVHAAVARVDGEQQLPPEPAVGDVAVAESAASAEISAPPVDLPPEPVDQADVTGAAPDVAPVVEDAADGDLEARDEAPPPADKPRSRPKRKKKKKTTKPDRPVDPDDLFPPD